MQQNILDIYKDILNYSMQIKDAIQKKEWDLVNILILKREEPIHKSVVYFAVNEIIEPELKKQIDQIISQIKKLDDENIKIIEEDKHLLELNIKKISKGQRALDAYKK